MKPDSPHYIYSFNLFLDISKTTKLSMGRQETDVNVVKLRRGKKREVHTQKT